MHTSIQFAFIENISRDNPLGKFLVAFRWPPFSHTLGFHDTRMYWWVFQESRSFRMQWQQFFSNYVKPFLKCQLTMIGGSMAQSTSQICFKKHTCLCYSGWKTWIGSVQLLQLEMNVSTECGEMCFRASFTFYYIFYAREDGQLFTTDKHWCAGFASCISTKN